QGHLQKQHDALAARGDEVELLQRRREPDDDRQGQQNDDERIRHLPKHVSAEERHVRRLDPPNGPLGDAPLSHANPLVPKTIPIRLRWRNFGLFGMACFPKRLVLPSAAAISRRCCKTAPVSPSEITVLCPLEGSPAALEAKAANGAPRDRSDRLVVC